MKMSKIKKYLAGIVLTSLLALGISSCKDYDFPVDESYARAFTPVLIEALNIRPGSADVVFNKVRGINDYVIELSRDSLEFGNIIQTYNVDRTLDTLKLTDLFGETRYSVRIKSISATMPESKWNEITFITPGEQIMEPVLGTEVTSNSVILRWIPGSLVTHLLMQPVGSAAIQIELTAEEMEQGVKIVSGLMAETTYSVVILNGENRRGTAGVTTGLSITGDAIVVDLRGISDRPTVLIDTLAHVPSGSVILLERGLTYNISTTTAIGKSLKIVSADDFGPRATLYFTSNFIFESGSTVDSLVFQDVNMYSDNYTSRYVFNANQAATVGTLKFQSVNARIFRGMVRLQSQPIIIENFIMDDCVVDSIRDYGVVNVDVVSSKIENYRFTNSTFFASEKFLSSRNNATSVVIENCTFHDIPKWANYLVDFREGGANEVAQPVQINNCIFGHGWANPADGDTGYRGVRVGPNSSVIALDSYFTSDYLVISHDIPGLMPFDGTAIELFRNPAKGDFTIISNLFPGRTTSGDPRWRP